MSRAMVRRLIYKDWFLNRWAIASWVALGIAALAAIGLGGRVAVAAGGIVLLTALVAVGIHLAMSTIVNERKEQTLAFVMTLPITSRDYTAGKIFANVAIFGGAWLVLLVGTVAVIAGRPAIPDGLIPFATVVLTQTFTGYCLLVAAALISESLAWTIGAIVAGNLLLQAVIFAVSSVPAIARDMLNDTIVWRAPVAGLLAAQLAAILLLLALTFYLQARKTHFV
jgi:ABC-2 type transport system permease protein